MKIDHIGIVVRDIPAAISHWHTIFGYTQLTEIVVNSRQKVKVVFLRKKNSILIKLIEPVDDSSPIYQFARRGGGLHHLCFKCDDMQREIKRLEDLDLRILVPPQPGEAFDNNDIAFIFAKMGLNIELIDTDIKAALLPGKSRQDEERGTDPI